MSNPNWPDDSQLFPGTPAQQPAPEQPANPTPTPADPYAPGAPFAPAPADAPFGQPPVMPPASPVMPPASPFGQPAPADPFSAPGANPFGAPAQPSFGQQPSAPNLYGEQPPAPFGQPLTPQPFAPQSPTPAPGFDQTNPTGDMPAFPAMPAMPAAPGMPGAGDPYTQPGTPMPPSVPPYGYPGTPSQQLPGYPGYPGYPGTPSQQLPTYQGTPSQQLPGYMGPPSQALYGQPAAPSVPMYGQPQWGAPSQTLAGTMPPARKRSKKPLIIALSIVLVLLLLAGGGAAYVVTSLGAPAAAATQFCGDLKTQNYTAAYGMFSSALQTKYSSDVFAKGAQALDQLEGNVTACDKATGSNAYSYSFGASTATLQAVITRARQGQLTGQIRLKNQNGTWKVDSLDTGLLGVNLDALQTVGGFCAALQSGDYQTAYGFFGGTPEAAISQSDFVANAQLDDKYDGALSACSLTAIASGNTDTATSVTVSVTRAKPGAKTTTVALDVEGGAWKISTIDMSVLGTDYRPLLVAQAFCSDYQKNNLSAAYGLMTPDSGVSKSDFIGYFELPSGIVVSHCGPNLSSYSVSGSSASLQVGITIADSSTGQSAKVNAAFDFALESGTWGISDLPQITLA